MDCLRLAVGRNNGEKGGAAFNMEGFEFTIRVEGYDDMDGRSERWAQIKAWG